MALKSIYAHLNCRDLATSTAWFSGLFARGPDARPMAGLAEWHHGDSAGFQLFQNAANAGHVSLTLIVEGIEDERDRLEAENLKPNPVEEADAARIVRLSDPDGNLVVLAEPTD